MDRTHFWIQRKRLQKEHRKQKAVQTKEDQHWSMGRPAEDDKKINRCRLCNSMHKVYGGGDRSCRQTNEDL